MTARFPSTSVIVAVFFGALGIFYCAMGGIYQGSQTPAARARIRIGAILVLVSLMSLWFGARMP